MADGNERNSPEPEIESAAGHEGAMAAIVSDDEQHGDEDAIQDGEEQVRRQRQRPDGAEQTQSVKRPIEEEKDEAMRQRAPVRRRFGHRFG